MRAAYCRRQSGLAEIAQGNKMGIPYQPRRSSQLCNSNGASSCTTQAPHPEERAKRASRRTRGVFSGENFWSPQSSSFETAPAEPPQRLSWRSSVLCAPWLCVP